MDIKKLGKDKILYGLVNDLAELDKFGNKMQKLYELVSVAKELTAQSKNKTSYMDDVYNVIRKEHF